jgi:hypothetical protein
MVDVIIWSRDRSAQLNALLMSIEKNFNFANQIYILWKATTLEYNKGYKKLFKKDFGLNYTAYQEKDFNRDIKRILKNSECEYIVGISDDCLFINKVHGNLIGIDDNSIAFSLRLGKGFNYCQPANLAMKEPKFIVSERKKDNILKWNWTEGDPRVCFYYPFACDSNIYHAEQWYDLIKGAKFNNPCQLEDYMNNHRDPEYPYMQCFEQPKLISISNNQTGQGANNTCGDQSQEFLNQKYLDGYIIDIEPFQGIEVKQCHIVQPYTFIKEK